MIAEMAAKLSRPNNQPKVVTLHDPSVNDLQYLQEHYPDARVTYIEIAVDAFLPDGSNDLYLLRQLKEQIRHCIAPQEHKNFTRAERKFWNIPENRRSLDAASHAAPLTTVTYEARNNGLSLKLYLKTIDQGKPVPVYCLRAEFALKTTAPAWAGLSNVADLPAFTKNLRKHCSKAFCIGRGFKESDTDGHKWKQFGASWDLQKRKGLRIRTDGVANRKFGDALNNLSRSLKRL